MWIKGKNAHSGVYEGLRNHSFQINILGLQDGCIYVSGRCRRGVINQKIQYGGIGEIFRLRHLSCEPSAALTFANCITRVLAHVSGEDRLRTLSATVILVNRREKRSDIAPKICMPGKSPLAQFRSETL